MQTVYYVAEEDPTKAQAIVAAVMAPNEKVEAFGPLPEAAGMTNSTKRPGRRWRRSAQIDGVS